MVAEVWLLYPAEQSLTAEPRRALEAGIAEREWSIQERPAPSQRVLGGRPVHCLEPRDASAVYKRAHRASVGVLVVDGVMVNRDPSRAPEPRRTIDVQGFLRYKGLVRRIPRAASRDQINTFLEDLDRMCLAVACEGEADPRILPLHVFDHENEFVDLDRPEGRKQFGDSYGHALRRDVDGREWQRAKVMHGREILAVAGRALPAGFHWDVQNPRRGPSRLVTTHEVWLLAGKGYANVHPDAYVRTRDGRAKVVWPPPRR